MKTNEILHGFVVKAEWPVEELAATLWEMEHEKTGAKLIWLDRSEENKTFGIAFQTQPWDDTGVFHILEHSVLCGSEKYPVKEPFVELLKTSLKTFLNAFTFPDKTLYPVCSRNDQDFLNLIRVYMDAVLHPQIYNKPEIFYQEGWHYELSEDGEATYKGVVFNEMKGAYASPDELSISEINRRLFPDVCYRYNAGGDPRHIPDLTYEQFRAAHQKFYHPSNSYIFLDGAMNIDRVLGVLDGDFLSAYDRIPTPGPLPMQQPVDGGTTEILYELGPQEDLRGRARIANGYVVCTFQEQDDLIALRAIADALCGDNDAPLKRRLLGDGLARDVLFYVYDGIQQPCVILEAKDVVEEKLEEATTAIREELEKAVREGLDHGRIRAMLDNQEFYMRQREYRYPQGLMFCFSVLELWLYGGNPAAALIVGDRFDRLREKCDAGYFEELLDRVVLQNPHRCQVIMRPSHTIGQEKQEKERARLRAAKEKWSDTETAAVRARQARIETWQGTPDTPEALATIPMLRLDQIPAEPEALPLEETEAHGIPILRHDLPASGITYFNLYFAIDDLTEEQLTKASFLCKLLGSLDTANYDLASLKRETRSLFGNLQFNVTAFGQPESPERCRTFLMVSASVLDSKAEKAMALLTEILTKTKLNDKEKVFDLLCQQRSMLLEQVAMSGNLYGRIRVSARLAATGVASETTAGITFLQWLGDLERSFPEKFPALSEDLADLAASVFTRARLTLSVTGTGETPMQTAAKLLADQLPTGSFIQPGDPVLQPWPHKNEGFVLPVDVSFAIMGGLFPDAAKGSAKVMAHTADLSYLWNAVRVQGGAYGVGMALPDTGYVGFSSFRDPSAQRTLGCYRETANFLENAQDLDLTGFIIGTVASADPLLTPRTKGLTADQHYWQHITHADLARQRREMLETKAADFVSLATELRAACASASICVLGSQRQIDACAGELDTVAVL